MPSEKSHVKAVLLRILIRAVSRKDLINSAVAFHFTWTNQRPPSLLVQYKSNSSGDSSWSENIQDLIWEFMALKSPYLRLIEADLKPIFEMQKEFTEKGLWPIMFLTFSLSLSPFTCHVWLKEEVSWTPTMSRWSAKLLYFTGGSSCWSVPFYQPKGKSFTLPDWSDWRFNIITMHPNTS